MLKRLNHFALLSAALFAASTGTFADAPAPYTTDFSKMPVGKPSSEIFILNGSFAVKEEAGEKFLELAGNPVDTFGVLFGAEGQTATDVAGRIFATADGKLFPEFGMGANDAGGWKLWLIPGQKALVLRKGDDEKARVPFDWISGKWTHFKLHVAPGASGWTIEGKAWMEGGKEPEKATIATTDTAAPPTGRASAWGQPYAGTAIRFDDLSAVPGSAK